MRQLRKSVPRSQNCEKGPSASRDGPRTDYLTFETNARNDYFTRAAERGYFDLTWKGQDRQEYVANLNGPTLKNGIATVMVDLPSGASVDDEIEFIARIRDSQRLFENHIKVTVKPKIEKSSGGGGDRKPPKDKEGVERERPSELESPNIKRVYRDEWEAEGFDEFTAMKIEAIGYSDDEASELYEFKVNMDNMPLENETKQKRLSKEGEHQEGGAMSVAENKAVARPDKGKGAETGREDGEGSATQGSVTAALSIHLVYTAVLNRAGPGRGWPRALFPGLPAAR